MVMETLMSPTRSVARPSVKCAEGCCEHLTLLHLRSSSTGCEFRRGEGPPFPTSTPLTVESPHAACSYWRHQAHKPSRPDSFPAIIQTPQPRICVCCSARRGCRGRTRCCGTSFLGTSALKD